MSEKDIIIKCPGCGSKNRVELDKVDKNPVCSKCKTPLPLGGSVDVSDADFNDVVLKSSLPVLVDFWAPWCGPCRMVSPIVKELGAQYAGRLVVAKLNTDDNRQTAARFKIMGIPTLILFKDGQPVDQVVGAAPKPQIEQLIRKHLTDS